MKRKRLTRSDNRADLFQVAAGVRSLPGTQPLTYTDTMTMNNGIEIRKRGAWSVEFDPTEPTGVPMVYGPRNAAGTFFCVHETGECGEVPVPTSVWQWLDNMESYAIEFQEKNVEPGYYE